MNSLVNFRDLGGMVTQEGQIVKSRRLLRSGELVGLTAQDQAALVEHYRLKTVIDFRTASEAVKKPDDTLAGVQYINLDIMKDVEDLAPNFAIFDKVKHVTEAHAFMKQAYQAMVMDEGAREGYRIFLRQVIELTDGALLFHCFAGKDRSGVAAALLLTLLGVSRDQIMADYMLTNEMRLAQNKEITEKLIKIGKGPQELAVIDVALSVQPEYLQHLFDYTDERFGSFFAYIQEVLNVSDSDAALLKSKYLEG